MKIVLQRVSSAKVEVAGETVGEIKTGFLVLFGAAKGDTKQDADRLAKKVCNLRIFEDENERINKSLADVGGQKVTELLPKQVVANSWLFHSLLCAQTAHTETDLHFLKQWRQMKQANFMTIFASNAKLII